MSTIRQVLFYVIAVFTFTACNKTQFKKTKGGLPYQVYPGKDTQRVKAGDFIKVSFTRKIKDSIYFTTAGSLPVYLQVNETTQPYDISELWTSLRVGDSVIATQMMDTFIKRSPQNIPPEFKKGDKITYYLKVLGAFSSDSAAKADYDKNNEAWLAGEIKTIEKYLADKNIKAEKTPSGVYVETLTPGTGNLIDSGKYISVNYTGTSWSGKKFDSNVDPAFNHVGPYPFIVGTQAMIKGFDEAAEFMRLGSKTRIYIPSVLAYAGNPSSPLIKPYENLMFDVEVVDVKNSPPPPPPMQQQPNMNAPQPQN